MNKIAINYATALGAAIAISDAEQTSFEKDAGILGAALSAGKSLLGNTRALYGLGGKASRVGQFLGKHDALRNMANYGMFSGTVGAALSEPGDRLSGFGKGLLTGTLGGAGWHYGGKLMRSAINRLTREGGRMASSKTFGGLAQRMRDTRKQGFGEILKSGKGTVFGDTAKNLGAKTLAATPVGAAALGGSMVAEEPLRSAFAPDRPPVRQPYRRPAARRMRPIRPMGLTPQSSRKEYQHLGTVRGMR